MRNETSVSEGRLLRGELAEPGGPRAVSSRLVAGSGEEGNSGEGWNGFFNTQAATAAPRGDVNVVRGCREEHASQ